MTRAEQRTLFVLEHLAQHGPAPDHRSPRPIAVRRAVAVERRCQATEHAAGGGDEVGQHRHTGPPQHREALGRHRYGTRWHDRLHGTTGGDPMVDDPGAGADEQTRRPPPPSTSPGGPGSGSELADQVRDRGSATLRPNGRRVDTRSSTAVPAAVPTATTRPPRPTTSVAIAHAR